MGKGGGGGGTTQVAEAQMPEWAETFIKNTFIPMAQGVAQNSVGNFENSPNALAQGKYLTGVTFPGINPIGQVTPPQGYDPLQVVTPVYTNALHVAAQPNFDQSELAVGGGMAKPPNPKPPKPPKPSQSASQGYQTGVGAATGNPVYYNPTTGDTGLSIDSKKQGAAASAPSVTIKTPVATATVKTPAPSNTAPSGKGSSAAPSGKNPSNSTAKPQENVVGLIPPAARPQQNAAPSGKK